MESKKAVANLLLRPPLKFTPGTRMMVAGGTLIGIGALLGLTNLAVYSDDGGLLSPGDYALAVGLPLGIMAVGAPLVIVGSQRAQAFRKQQQQVRIETRRTPLGTRTWGFQMQF
jgi:hypothetical protein